jgi:hypothetical protein
MQYKTNSRKKRKNAKKCKEMQHELTRYYILLTPTLSPSSLRASAALREIEFLFPFP